MILRGEKIRENPITGEGNTELQEEYRREFQRAGVRDIHLGRLRRKLLTISVIPSSDRKSPRVCTLGPITYHRDAELVVMWDRQRLHANPRSTQVETAVLVGRGRVDLDGVVTVGSVRDAGRTHLLDFAAIPRQPYQHALRLDDLTVLKANVWQGGGEYAVRCWRDSVDLCVGHLPGLRQRAVMYRFDRMDFAEENPSAVLAMGTIPDVGHEQVFGRVGENTVLVRMRRKCKWLQARTDKGGRRPIFGWPHEPVLCAYNSNLFRLLNQMVRVQNDIALGADAGAAPVTDVRWAPSALVAFPREVARTLASANCFQPSELLQRALLHGLSPEGDFRIRAERSGTIHSVGPAEGQPHLMRVLYEDGYEQLLPITSKLINARDDGLQTAIESGSNVVDGQMLGYYCDCRLFTWRELREHVGPNLTWLLNKFLWDRSVQPGQSGYVGTAVLLPSQYVPALMNSAMRDSHGIVWYWDLRAARFCYSDEFGNIVGPPIAFLDWNVTEFEAKGVRYNLARRSRRKQSHRPSSTLRRHESANVA